MNFNFCPSCGREGMVEERDSTNYECVACGWHFWNNAKAATALALVQDGKLLVVERAREPNKGKLELAGGFVDFGETAQAAVIREAKEELGITSKPADLQLVDIYHNNYLDSITTVDIAFLVTRWQGEPTPSDDVAAIMWKPLNFIYDRNFCQKYYTGLDEAIAAKLA